MGKAVWIFVLLLVVGCAYIDQNLKVTSSANIAPSDIGKGKQVGLRIVDDRTDTMIGKRVNGYGVSGAKITTNQDLEDVLKTAVSQGLQKKGFAVVDFSGAPVAIKVELRSLEYDTATGLWTGGNIGKAVIKVLATGPAGKTYEKSYHGQKEIRTAFIGSQETNTKVVNGALDQAMEGMFKDEELFRFLKE